MIIEKNILNFLLSYSKIYHNYLLNLIDEEKLSVFKEKVKDIPSEVIDNLEFFVKLDKEYIDYSSKRYGIDSKVFSAKYFKDTNWEGLRLK